MAQRRGVRMSNPAMQIRPPADADRPSAYHTRAAIPEDTTNRFLAALAEFGQVTYASNVCGMARRSLYDRRSRDAEFAQAWDEALAAFEETLTQRVIATALHMGTGRWVPALDPVTGDQELDEDLEPLMRFDCSQVDPRVAIKLMALRMRDVNERTAPLVAVQNNLNAAAPVAVTSGAELDLEALRAELRSNAADVELIEDDEDWDR